MDLVMAAHAQAAAMAQLYAANAAALAATSTSAPQPVTTGGQGGGIPMLSGTSMLGSAFIQGTPGGGPPSMPQPPPPPPIRS